MNSSVTIVHSLSSASETHPTNQATTTTRTRTGRSNPPKLSRSLPSGKASVKHLSLRRQLDHEEEQATAVHEVAEVDVVAATGVREHYLD